MINFQLFQECVLTGKTPNRRYRTSGQNLGESKYEEKEDSDEELDRKEVTLFTSKPLTPLVALPPSRNSHI